MLCRKLDELIHIVRYLIQGQPTQRMIFGRDRIACALQSVSFARDSSVMLARTQGSASAMSAREIGTEDKDGFIAHFLLPLWLAMMIVFISISKGEGIRASH
jgi:hypothetical protein